MSGIALSTHNAKVTIPYVPLLNNTLCISYSGTANGLRRVLCATNTNKTAHLCIETNNRIGFIHNDTFTALGTLFLVDSTRYNLALYASATTFYLYNNGVLVGSATHSFTTDELNIYYIGNVGGLCPSTSLAPSTTLAPSSAQNMNCNGTIYDFQIYEGQLDVSYLRGIVAMPKPMQLYSYAQYLLDSAASDDLLTPAEKQSYSDYWHTLWNADQVTTALPTAIGSITTAGEYRTNALLANSVSVWTPTTPGSSSYNFYQAVEAYRKYLFDSTVNGCLLTTNVGKVSVVSGATIKTLLANIKVTTNDMLAAVAYADSSIKASAAQANAIAAATVLNDTLALEVDKKIQVFWQPTAPTTGMATNDLWYDIDDGNKCYIYNGTTWLNNQDSQIGTAIANAATAQATADGKSTVFATLALAQASAEIGDLFMMGGMLYRCITALAATYERITPKNWGVLTTAPTSGMIVNDTYYNSSNTTSYYYSGSAWVVSSVSVASNVVAYTPKYLGRYLDTHPTPRNNGDWWLVYGLATASLTRGFWYDASGTPTLITALGAEAQRKYRASGLEDVLYAANNGYALTSGGVYDPEGIYGVNVMSELAANTAFITYLMAEYLKVGQSVYGGARFDKDGNEINTATDGFYLGSNGKLKANLQSLFRSNTIVGTDAGLNIQNTGNDSNYNTIVGYGAGFGSATSVYYASSFFGYGAGATCTTGYHDTFVGAYAGFYNTSGTGNSYFGHLAGYINDTGSYNSLFGMEAGKDNPGSYNSFFGVSTGFSVPFNYSNCGCFGYNARVTGSNQIQLGNADTTTYVYGTVQNRSDGRDKSDIIPETLGLDFINKLTPVQFKWDMREFYKVHNEDRAITELEKDGSKKRTRYHNGFIAQDIKTVMDELDIDFGGYQDHSVNGGEDVLSLGYDEFIAPICKAIQELSAKVDALTNQGDKL